MLAGQLFDVDPKTVWAQCLLEDPETHKEKKTRAAKYHRLWLSLDACDAERREDDHYGQQEILLVLTPMRRVASGDGDGIKTLAIAMPETWPPGLLCH